MSVQEQLFLCATGAVDIALAVWLLRHSAGNVSAARCGAVAVVIAAFALLRLPLAMLVSDSFFFAVSIAYVDLVVALPVAAAIVFLRTPRRSMTGVAKALLLALTAGPALVGVYATFIEPFRLVEERVDVALARKRAPSEPMRVAVLADLQSREVDEHLREAIRLAMAFEPHLIVLPGDLIQADSDADFERVADDFRALLAPLNAPLGVYFVIGNTDDVTRVRGVFTGTNVRLLDNESVELEYAGRRVLVGGAGFQPFAPRTRSFVESFDRREADELRILVAHYPDVVLDLDSKAEIDLIIAGHTHGGQVQIPGFGAPLTLSGVPRAVGSGGLHEIEGRSIYVSRGIGCERGAAPRLRFCCPPEVSLLTLRAP